MVFYHSRSRSASKRLLTTTQSVAADEVDWENARQRKAALLADPAFYKPPIVDEGEDYFAEIYNMPVLP